MMTDHQIRASDRDRDDAAVVLAEAYAAGRLTRDELGQRAAAAYAARTWAELRALTSDLPPGRPFPAFRETSPGCGRTQIGEQGTARLRLITHLAAILVLAAMIGLAGLAVPVGMWVAAVLIPAALLLPPAIGISAALQHPRQGATATPRTQQPRTVRQRRPCRRQHRRVAGCPRDVAPGRRCRAGRTARPRRPW